jgi:hypothetical protein
VINANESPSADGGDGAAGGGGDELPSGGELPALDCPPDPEPPQAATRSSAKANERPRKFFKGLNVIVYQRGRRRQVPSLFDLDIGAGREKRGKVSTATIGR